MTLLDKKEMVLNEEVNLDNLQLIRDNFDLLYDQGWLGRFDQNSQTIYVKTDSIDAVGI